VLNIMNTGREKLFDLAINRSLSFAKKMGKLRVVDTSQENNLIEESDLLNWHQQTRFAYRIPLLTIVQCLNALPDTEKEYCWLGGETGAWIEGKTSQP